MRTCWLKSNVAHGKRKKQQQQQLIIITTREKTVDKNVHCAHTENKANNAFNNS